MHTHVNLVDLVKSFPTNIFLQNLTSIQKRTSPIKFAHLGIEGLSSSQFGVVVRLALPPLNQYFSAVNINLSGLTSE